MSSNVWLSADARIDNRADLTRTLEGRVKQPLDTDADFILAAYEHWGVELAQHLLGDFAFTIWDEDRKRLLLVRDHIGIRPAYWALTTNGGFVASSTLRATLEASGLPRDADPAFLATFSTFNGDFGHHTPWAGVQRLPGGHSLTVSPEGKVKTWRYWSPPDQHLDIGVDAAAEELHSILKEAVQCRLRSSCPVGLQLSGGFDSTTVSALARSASDHDSLIAYALTFPGGTSDESPYIDAAEAHLKIRTRRFDALQVAPYDHGADCRASLDVPLLPDNKWLTPLAHLAAADGCRVVLTGQGGDHALYGNCQEIARDLLERNEFSAAWRAGRDTTDGRVACANLLARSAVRRYLSRHDKGVGSAVARRVSRRRIARHRETLVRFLGPALRGQVIPNDTYQRSTGRFDRARWSRRASYTGQMSYFTEIWDRTAVSSGVEFRHPFLDVRLIEFVCQLGEDILTVGNSSRGLHARAFADLLPELVLKRTDKADFGEDWVRAALDSARLVGSSADPTLDAFLERAVLNERTLAYTVDPHREFNLWNWWGAIAVGLWVLNGKST